MRKTTRRWGAALAAFLASAATLLGAATGATAAESRVSPTDLAKPQPLTVQAQTDISGRKLRAVPLAWYSYATHDNGKLTSFDVTDAGHAASIDKELKAAGIDCALQCGHAVDAGALHHGDGRLTGAGLVDDKVDAGFEVGGLALVVAGHGGEHGAVVHALRVLVHDPCVAFHMVEQVT